MEAFKGEGQRGKHQFHFPSIAVTPSIDAFNAPCENFYRMFAKGSVIVCGCFITTAW